MIAYSYVILIAFYKHIAFNTLEYERILKINKIY